MYRVSMRGPLRKAAAVILGLSAASFGFDGHKQGFVLGGGAGLGYTTFNQQITGAPDSPQQNKLGLATDFVVGYGFNQNFLLTYFSNANEFPITNIHGDDILIANGNSGIGAFYYFDKSPVFRPSFYLFGGVGLSGWSVLFERDGTSWTGLGVTGGAGYEFRPHFGAQLNLFAGNPSGTSNGGVHGQSNAFGFQLLLVALAY